MSIFGLPVVANDIEVNQVLFSRALNMNFNSRVPVSDQPFNSSDVHIPFKLDFTQRKYFWSYFAFMDVVSAIGGVNAAITPLMKKFAPWFMVYVLYALAKIIKNKYLEDYRNELGSVVNNALNQLKTMGE